MKRLIPFLILLTIGIWTFNFFLASSQVIKENNNKVEYIKMKIEFEGK